MKTLVRILMVLAALAVTGRVQASQCNPGPAFGCGFGWTISDVEVAAGGGVTIGEPPTITPIPFFGLNVVFIAFQNNLVDPGGVNHFTFFNSMSFIGPNANNFILLSSSPGLGLPSTNMCNPSSLSFCGIYLQYIGPPCGPQTASLFLQGLPSFPGGPYTMTIPLSSSGTAPCTTLGKVVLFQTQPSPDAGARCFDSATTPCYELYADLNVDSNGNITTATDPTGYVLATDNGLCGGGNPKVTGAVSGPNVALDVSENILYGALGGTVRFSGNYASSQPYTGFNFDGTQAPFSGAAGEVLGTNTSASGCPLADAGVTFQSWSYPSLGTATLTIGPVGANGAPSTPLNQGVVINADITEDPTHFSVTGSGTLTGPNLPTGCGPLTFTLTSGDVLGNLYGLNGAYTNASGGTGTISIGLSLITPYTVSQSQLQAAGYTATSAGFPLSAWSLDWSASSDGFCPADPAIAQGVAYSSKKTVKSEPPKQRHHEHFDWSKYHHARVANDRDSALGGKHEE